MGVARLLEVEQQATDGKQSLLLAKALYSGFKDLELKIRRQIVVFFNVPAQDEPVTWRSSQSKLAKCAPLMALMNQKK
jgi:hypothetical protein